VLQARTILNASTRGTHQLGPFYIFTPDDTDVFAYNKRKPERAVEPRERDIHQQGEKAGEADEEKDWREEIPIDPRLLGQSTKNA
jgi:hypothetical protein